MNRFIRTNSFYLRSISADDASNAYLSWLNDPETTLGLASGTFPSNIQDLRKYLSSVTESKDAVMLAICMNDSEEHIGNVKLDRFDWISRTAELGILIGSREHRGIGIGTETCKAIAEYAFKTLNLRKILLAVYANNPAAIRSYEKAGFTTEAVLKAHVFAGGEYVDKCYMSIFNPDLQ